MTRKKIKVSSHARERARERLDVHHHTDVNKELNNAVMYGHPLNDYTGEFARFLENKKKHNRGNVGFKVYKETILVYRNKTIITTYKVPDKFLPTDNYLRSSYAYTPYVKKLYDIYGEDKIEYKVFPPGKNGGSYTTGLFIDDVFIGFGMGTTQEKSINAVCRSHLKRINIESDDKDEVN